MKKTVIILSLAAICILGFYIWQRANASNMTISALNNEDKEDERKKGLHIALQAKATEALSFCKKNNMNTDFCILVDFSIHSGLNRFFVWNFKTDSILVESLCAHGRGGESTAKTPEFSNVENSYMSSLGKYKLGIRSYSNWGINIHYKMHGLEKTNDKAFERIIVLHSYEYVAESPTYPTYLPLGFSLGCPVVSDNSMREIDSLMKEAKNPNVLLWIYN